MTKKPRHKALTPKEEKLVRLVSEDNGLTNREAYRQAYDAKNMTNASVDTEVSRTLDKPHVKSQLMKYSNLAENTLVNTINDWGSSDDVSKRTLAINSSKYVHDKIHGKATQRTEVRTEVVSLSLDLTGEVTEVEE